jgi:hypothetical protein
MGPPTIEKIMTKYLWCRTFRIIAYAFRSCKDNFNTLPTPAFNPIPWQHTSSLLFGPESEGGDVVRSLTGRATYGIHIGNAFTKKFRILLKSDSVIAGIVKGICPVTCEIVGDEM